MNERHECGRCGGSTDVRSTIANLAREARQDGHQHTGPSFEVAFRCHPCRELNRKHTERENR